STECGHKQNHQANAFCDDGKCRWAGNTKCIAESKREQVEILIDSDALTVMKDHEFVDAIMEIFEGKKEGHIENPAHSG
ncbi:MAG: hypothetical protein ACYDHW_06080, partial [Syntrophorhabdaceae bacterium]